MSEDERSTLLLPAHLPQLRLRLKAVEEDVVLHACWHPGMLHIMEDGYAIARYLDEGRADPAAALAAFERDRQPRGARMQLQARQQFQNNQLVPLPPPLPVDWIYGYDAVTSALHPIDRQVPQASSDVT